jgi:mono/diheme cytochrome c family protein
MRSAVAFLTGVVVTLAIPAAIVWLGLVDMSAAEKPGWLERTIGEEAFEGWLERTAPATANPLGADAAVLREGLEHYRENCVVCHAAPDVQRSEIAKGLHPGAPSLWKKGTQSMTDGQIFWAIRQGVAMTGMPAFGKTHSDDDVWRIVAFVRHLNDLAPAEKKALAGAATEEEQHHHHQDAGEEPRHSGD